MFYNIPYPCLPILALNIFSDKRTHGSVLPVSGSSTFPRGSNTTLLQDKTLRWIELVTPQNMTNRNLTKQHMALTDKNMLAIYILIEMYPKNSQKQTCHTRIVYIFAMQKWYTLLPIFMLLKIITA